MKFDVYSDPSHGWVKVPRKLLIQLGIETEISTCSYERGDFVYLEWDDDAPKFIEAMKKKGKSMESRHHSTDRRSRIRSYSPFKSYGTKVPHVPEPVDMGFVERPVPVHSDPMVDGEVVEVGDLVSFDQTLRIGKVISIVINPNGPDHILVMMDMADVDKVGWISVLRRCSQCSHQG